jgi:hypothetical protein
MSSLHARIAGVGMKFLHQGSKTDTHVTLEGVSFVEAVRFVPGLSLPCNHHVTKGGAVHRTCLVPLDKLQLQEFDAPRDRHGSSTVDLQSNSWHTLTVLVVHVTPKAGTMRAPSLKVQWLVCTLHADMTFKMDIKFVGSKIQKLYFPQWSELSEMELEARCRLELFGLKDAAIFHDGDERRDAARLSGTAALETLKDRLVDHRQAKVARITRGASVVVTDFETRKAAALKSCAASLLKMSSLGGKPVIAFERSAKGVIEGEIHHGKCCNCPGSLYIFGDRYYCEICEDNHCSSCYVHHNPAHPLTLFRMAEPYTDTDLWTVTDAGVFNHKDVDGVRRFSLRFKECEGWWHLTRGELNNDALIDAYEDECAAYDANRNM